MYDRPSHGPAVATRTRMRLTQTAHAISAQPAVVCVDLDGTLIAGDLLWESFVELFKRHPLRALGALLSLWRGKAHFKNIVSRHIEIDPAIYIAEAEFAAFPLVHGRAQRTANTRADQADQDRALTRIAGAHDATRRKQIVSTARAARIAGSSVPGKFRFGPFRTGTAGISITPIPRQHPLHGDAPHSRLRRRTTMPQVWSALRARSSWGFREIVLTS